MKKIRKILSFMLAGVVGVTSLFAGSAAADAVDKKLTFVTAPFDDVSKIWDIGKNVAYCVNGDKASMIKFTANAAKYFRETGKLKIPTIKIETQDGDPYTLPNNLFIMYSNFKYSNYARFKDTDNVSIDLGYDKENKRFVYYETEFEDHTEFIAPNGNRLFFVKNDDGTKVFTLYSHDLSEKIAEVKGKYTATAFADGSRHCVLSDPDSDEPCVLTLSQTGELNKVSDQRLYPVSNGYQNVCFCNDESKAQIDSVYYTATNTFYPVKNITKFTDKDSGLTYFLDGFNSDHRGTKFVGFYYAVDSNGESVYKYVVVDIAKDKFLSTAFDNAMYFRRSDIMYVVKNGKIGFADLNGKVLKLYDDAGSFYNNSKYAPVINNGQFYLVDRNFKVVSEKMKVEKGTAVYSFPNDFYLLEAPDGEVTFVTYK